MAKIRTGRIVAGGLAAGVVMNICDFVINNYILSEAWQRAAAIRNLDAAALGSTPALVTFVTIDFLLGTLLVWLYAAIRPRFGPGPATAIIASFAVFAACTLVVASYSEWFSWDLVIKSSGLSLVSIMAAGLAGAWMYREDGPAEEPEAT
jgi:hypothetical protein